MSTIKSIVIIVICFLIGSQALSEGDKLPIGWKACFSEKGPDRAEYCFNGFVKVCNEFPEPGACLARIASQWRMFDINLRVSEYLRIEREKGAWNTENFGDHLLESTELTKKLREECQDSDVSCTLKFNISNAYKRWSDSLMHD